MTREIKAGTMPPEIAAEIRDTGLRDDFLTEGDYTSIGMLIIDSVLRGDEETLRIMHDGLRRLYGHTVRNPLTRLNASRITGLIDASTWALRREPWKLEIRRPT